MSAAFSLGSQARMVLLMWRVPSESWPTLEGAIALDLAQEQMVAKLARPAPSMASMLEKTARAMRRRQRRSK